MKFKCILLVYMIPVVSAFLNNVQEGGLNAVFLDDTNRIVGGIVVSNPNKYKSYAISAGNLQCGATLIHDDILLTAAHCYGAFITDGVYIGGNNVYGNNANEYIQVIEEIQHPNFNTTSFFNDDIMIVKLAKPSKAPKTKLNFKSHIGDNPNVSVKVIGYGTTDTEDFSTYLRHATIKIVDTTICTALLYDLIDDNLQICAGTYNGGKNACFGDSGGPLYYKNTLQQIGIVSYGTELCSVTPVIYTRISSYKEFIQKQICDYSNVKPKYCIKYT